MWDEQGVNPEQIACRIRSKPGTGAWVWCRVLVSWLLALGCAGTALGAIQFDVFLGYDGIIPEASWFPVVFEIKNDGPTFAGTVELQGGQLNPDQGARTVVELPTGT